MSKIDNNSYISIPLVISFIGAFIGALVWLTSIYVAATTALARTEELNTKYDIMQSDTIALRDRIAETNQRLSSIEGKLDLILQSKKR